VTRRDFVIEASGVKSILHAVNRKDTGTTMYEALLVIFLLISIGLVALIMLQQGKGADMGASFGAGASGTLFGSTGSGNFMTRMTAVLATLFFVISLILGNLSSNKNQKGSEWENLGQPVKIEQTTAPAEPAKPSSDIPR
jgi:preprotein translocase subunit SecG